MIGGGPGGIAVAAAAAAFDFSAALIEKGRLGGESLNRGSVPAQALIAAADRANATRTNAQFGIKTAVRRRLRGRQCVCAACRRRAGAKCGARTPRGPWRECHCRRGAFRRSANRGRRRRHDPGAPFRHRHRIVANYSGHPRPSRRAIFHRRNHLRSQRSPRHLIVVGAGAVGLELAQAFRRLGSEVTVIESAMPLSGADPEAAAVVLSALVREGIRLRSGVAIDKVCRVLGRVQVGLAAPDGRWRRSKARIFSSRPAGDRMSRNSTSTPPAYHHAPRHYPRRLHAHHQQTHLRRGRRGRRAEFHSSRPIPRRDRDASRAVRDTGKIDRESIPWVTFTDPELAHVGLLEEEARAHSGIIRVLRWPYRENDRAHVDGSNRRPHQGRDRPQWPDPGGDDRRRHAAESIAPWTLAISQKLNIRALAGMVVPYPTYAEVGKRAAITYFTQGLTTLGTRRIMGWLRRWR